MGPEDRLSIAARFCGPDGSGNGGYTAGLVAQRLRAGAAIEVTLRRPPPLDRPLQLARDSFAEGGVARLIEGGQLIAEARLAEVALEVPSAPGFPEAEALAARFVGHRRHDFASCFVCGTARAAGDGLRIFPGRQGDVGLVAAPFVPPDNVADATGVVWPEVVWAALDCSGYFGVAVAGTRPALLGRMTAELVSPLRAGEQAVVVGWGLGGERRKLFAGTALFGGDGRVVGRSRQVWITL